jgi:hypothetical protein
MKQKESIIQNMNNTLDTIINSMIIEMNEEIIDNLTGTLGYSREEAAKVVTEYSDFDLSAHAAEFPVTNTESNF